jgi:Spy/CpxP family protein refolding chaperone
MNLKVYALCAFLLLGAQPLLAQQQPNDPIGESLFPPELVMQHQQAIGLSEDQKQFIKAEIRKAQARFTDLHWQLQDEAERLVSLLTQDQVDEQQTLTQLDKILSVEREIKRAQFTLLIQIKNKLTPEQRARLTELRNKSKGR